MAKRELTQFAPKFYSATGPVAWVNIVFAGNLPNMPDRAGQRYRLK